MSEGGLLASFVERASENGTVGLVLSAASVGLAVLCLVLMLVALVKKRRLAVRFGLVLWVLAALTVTVGEVAATREGDEAAEVVAGGPTGASSDAGGASMAAMLRDAVAAPLRAIAMEATLLPAFAGSLLVGFGLGAKREA